MITPVNILLIILWGLIIPFIAGGAVNAFAKSPAAGVKGLYRLPFGFMIMCALFIVPAIPMILLHVPFHILKYTWIVLVLAACAAGVVFGVRGKKEVSGASEKDNTGEISENKEETSTESYEAKKNPVKELFSDKLTLCVWLVAILLIAFQTALLTVRMHTDTDDARFIVDAMEALHKDTMLQYNPITGVYHGIPVGEQVKDVTAPYPIFIALMSSLTLVHPAINAHTVMPLLFIPLSYVVFALIGGLIYKGDLKKRGLFLVFLSLIHLFSFETIYSAGYTLLTIIWQGRSIAAMIMLPLLWYLLLKMGDTERPAAGDFAMIGICALANAMLSNMGSLFAFILAMGYALSYSIQDKKIKPLVYMALAMVPDLLVIAVSRLLSSGILYR